MKLRVVFGTCLILAALIGASLLPAGSRNTVQAQNQFAGSGAPPPSNPLKVALLKWYNANTVPTEFSVGAGPLGVAFDGANIWVAGSNLTKLRASDGAGLRNLSHGRSRCDVRRSQYVGEQRQPHRRGSY